MELAEWLLPLKIIFCFRVRDKDETCPAPVWIASLNPKMRQRCIGHRARFWRGRVSGEDGRFIDLRRVRRYLGGIPYGAVQGAGLAEAKLIYPGPATSYERN